MCPQTADMGAGQEGGGRGEAGMCLGPDRTGGVVTATYVAVANSMLCEHHLSYKQIND